MRTLRTLVPLTALTLLGACATGLPRDVVDLARETKPGGSFFVEFDADGTVLGADAEVAVERLPPALVAAANAEFPGGEVIGAEKEWFDGRRVWEVVKRIDGRTWEIPVGDAGQILGGEETLAESAWPAGIRETALSAAGGGTVNAVERVWGPEAHAGESYHVKIERDGDSLRVGVAEDGRVVRVVRRISGQVRVPR